MKSVLVLAVLLSTGAFAGCIGDEQSEGAPLGMDPADAAALAALAVAPDDIGDAMDGRIDGFYYGGGCSTTDCIDTPDTPSETATPAPWMDIAAIRVADTTGENVVIAFDIAEIEENFPRLGDHPGGNRYVSYMACFGSGEEAAIRCAEFEVREIGGQPVIAGTFFLLNENCGGFYKVCMFNVDASVQYGAPALLSVSIPKTYLAYDEAPAIITSLGGRVFWSASTDAAPHWHYAYSMATNGDYVHDHEGPGGPGNLVDSVAWTEFDLPFVPATGPWPSSPSALLEGTPGNHYVTGGPYDRADLDLLKSELWVENDEVVLQYTMREMHEFPAFAAHWDSLVAFSGASMIEMGVRKDTNALEPYAYMGRCIGFHCGDVKELRGAVDFEHGAPATMTVRFPASEFGLDVKGTTVNFFVSVTMLAEYSLMVGEHDESTAVDIHAMSLVDTLSASAPYTIGGGAPLPLVSHEAHEH